MFVYCGNIIKKNNKTNVNDFIIAHCGAVTGYT